MIRKRKRKLPLWFIREVRKETKYCEYFKRRYYHFKILAFEFAKNYYSLELSPEDRFLANENFIRYNKKADWCFKKANDVELLEATLEI